MKNSLIVYSLIIAFFYKPVSGLTIRSETVPKSKSINDPFAPRDYEVNPHNFDYIFNPKFQTCGMDDKDPVFVLVYVHTAPSNLRRRLAIRETWARRSMFKDLRILFMMGKTEENKTTELLKLEASTYNDIVQEDFLDSYKNLTYKGIMAMKWISTYCNKAKYVLKVDDDIITNTFIILRHLKSWDRYKINQEKTVMCLVWYGMQVMREERNKWYVSKEEYGPDWYSEYCSGSAYMFTGDIPKAMYEVSKRLKFLWVDDFYITGLLVDAVNATRQSISSIYEIASGRIDKTFTGEQAEHKAFGHLSHNVNNMYRIWKVILGRQLAKHPSLKSFAGDMTHNFAYIEDFKWSLDIWKPFFDDGLKNVSSLFDMETF